MIRLGQRNSKVVRTKRPCIEMGECINLLVYLAVGRNAIHAAAICTWLRSVEVIGIGKTVVIDEEKRNIDDRLRLDRHWIDIRSIGRSRRH